MDSPNAGSKIIEYTNDEGISIFNADINIPTYNKIQSSESVFGTSISIRVSLQSNNMLDDTNATIIDKTDSTQSLNNFSEIFETLQKSLNIIHKWPIIQTLTAGLPSM